MDIIFKINLKILLVKFLLQLNISKFESNIATLKSHSIHLCHLVPDNGLLSVWEIVKLSKQNFNDLLYKQINNSFLIRDMGFLLYLKKENNVSPPITIY